MKRYFSLLLLFVLSSTLLSAQSRNKKTIEYSGFFDSYYWRGPWSFTAGASVPLYSGDICDELDCNEINPGFLFGVGYKVWPRVFFGGELHSFKIAAESTKQGPYLSLSSNVIGMKLFGRLYLREDIIHRHSQINKKPKVFKPYLMLGVNPLYVSPEVVKTDGTMLETQPNFTLSIPGGIGFSFDFSRRLSAIFELNGNYTFGDNIDGVATGNSSDIFMMAEVKIQYSPWAKRLKPKKVHFDGPASTSPASGSNTETTSAPAPYTPPPAGEETTEEEPIEEQPVEDLQDDNQYEESEDSYEYEETPSEEEPAEESTDDWGSPGSW